MISHKKFVFNPFQENTSVLWNQMGDCIILDPGCSSKAEENQLLDFIRNQHLRPVGIWLTHCHIDHVLGLDFCLKLWKIPYYLHPYEAQQLKAVEAYAPAYGFHDFKLPENDGIAIESEIIDLGIEQFRIFFVPGHSPGHLAFYHSESAQIWAGDVLFQNSVGRTDLPGGDFSRLEDSIRTVLYALPDETTVHPGHGPATSIGHEKKFNAFIPEKKRNPSF
jgi:hydroxyacylglutathione hydrolase